VIKLGNRDVPAKLVLQSISKSDLAVGNHGGERRTSKNLGDRADAHEGVAVGRLPVALGGLSITVHDRFAVSYDRDDEPGHVCAEKYECAGEIDGVVQQRACRARRSSCEHQAGRNGRCVSRNAPDKLFHHSLALSDAAQ
jgi:hypothetical protein